MAQIDNGFPWQGQQYNAPLSSQITEGLGAVILRATAEAASHPGLYQARYDDSVTPQEWIRPALIVPPSERDKWDQLLSAGIGAGNGG